jgi:hypothetical protein
VAVFVPLHLCHRICVGWTLIKTEQKYLPAAWKWVAGFLLTAAAVAALIGLYVYFHSPH